MKGQEVVLTDMLACRERRVNMQNEYIQKISLPSDFILHEYSGTYKDE